MKKLTPSQRALLEAVVSRRDSSRATDVSRFVEGSDLSFEQRDGLFQLVTDEFIESGRGYNDEPNKRGLLLEELIDRLNPHSE